MKNILYKIYKKIINIPFVWRMGQNFLGANQWKNSIYRSVFKSKGKILDFGCSVGNTTGVFLDFDYYGVDSDDVAIAGAKKFWKNNSNASFFTLDIVRDGFKKDFFDHVLFACTGHHLDGEELPRVFKALFENLKVGGEMHFFDPIRQEKKDGWTTKFINDHDQGKFVRDSAFYEKFFKDNNYVVLESKIFESPKSLIKLPDIFYAKIIKR